MPNRYGEVDPYKKTGEGSGSKKFDAINNLSNPENYVTAHKVNNDMVKNQEEKVS